MKEIVTPKGVLKYRMPNIIEAYDLLDASGVSDGVKSTLKLKRNIMLNMGCLIDHSGIEGAVKYEDLFDMVEEMINPLSEIADEVVTKAFDAFKKKS